MALKVILNKNKFKVDTIEIEAKLISIIFYFKQVDFDFEQVKYLCTR